MPLWWHGGVEQAPNMIHHRKLTLEKNIFPPLLPGLKLTTCQSWVWHSVSAPPGFHFNVLEITSDILRNVIKLYLIQKLRQLLEGHRAYGSQQTCDQFFVSLLQWNQNHEQHREWSMLQNNSSWVCYCENKITNSTESGECYKTILHESVTVKTKP